jgi:uncharacterized protein (DUF362 family)
MLIMAVAIKRNKNPKKALDEAFAELKFIPGKKVFIKPNLCGRDPVLPGENTSVEVMDALIEILSFAGCEIIIGHGELLGSQDHFTDFNKTLKDSGFDKYKNIKRVKIINLDNLKRTETKEKEMVFHLPLEFLCDEIDTYINLAKIKTHMETTVSFSLKNQMGLASKMDRVMMHKMGLEKLIASLGRLCEPDISILEGFPAMEDNGPHHGTPRGLDLIIAGDNMVELDSFTAGILGYDSGAIKHIRHAEELGVGKCFNKEHLSRYEEFIVKDFKRANNVYRFGLRMFAYPTYSCSRCINAVNLAGREFKKHPLKYWRVIWKALFSKNKINIIFGRADELKTGKTDLNICVGNCARKFAEENNAHCLDRCPPGIREVREFIVKKIQ